MLRNRNVLRYFPYRKFYTVRVSTFKWSLKYLFSKLVLFFFKTGQCSNLHLHIDKWYSSKIIIFFLKIVQQKYIAYIEKFTDRGVFVCLWLGNRVPYLIKSVTILELEEANKLVNKYERKRKDASTFWISSLRTGSRCSSGVYMKTMMCLRFAKVNGTNIVLWIYFIFFLDEFIQERNIIKERQTLVLSRITNSSVVFRGLNKRIMTYKLRCPSVTIHQMIRTKCISSVHKVTLEDKEI